jgi:hypothetical protein
MAEQKYLIVDGHKKINGKSHAPGEIIECDAETAARLRLQPVKEAEPATPPPPPQGSEAKGETLNVSQMAEKIATCETAEAVDALIEGDTRKGVIDAAEKQKAKLAADEEKSHNVLHAS